MCSSINSSQDNNGNFGTTASSVIQGYHKAHLEKTMLIIRLHITN